MNSVLSSPWTWILHCESWNASLGQVHEPEASLLKKGISHSTVFQLAKYEFRFLRSHLYSDFPPGVLEILTELWGRLLLRFVYISKGGAFIRRLSLKVIVQQTHTPKHIPDNHNHTWSAYNELLFTVRNVSEKSLKDKLHTCKFQMCNCSIVKKTENFKLN